MLGILLIVALFAPSISISPSVITTAYSSRSDELNGYGLQLQIDKVSLGYHKVVHSYQRPEKLDRREGEMYDVCVFMGMANLWELNYDIWQKGNYKIGVGINKIRNKEIGWQIFGETTIGSSLVFQLGYRQIHITRDANLLTAGFRFNL